MKKLLAALLATSFSLQVAGAIITYSTLTKTTDDRLVEVANDAYRNDDVYKETLRVTKDGRVLHNGSMEVNCKLVKIANGYDAVGKPKWVDIPRDSVAYQFYVRGCGAPK